MTIGEKIKVLRQERNITQKKLAEYLNTTYQAVSKWENNNALPDITLVLPLANFFGVSIDELFDRDADRQTAEIEEYEKRGAYLANKGYVAERIALWREAVKKFPGDFSCLINLACALFISIHSDGMEDSPEQNAKEVIEIGERILRDCTDNEIRNSMVQLLVYTYSDKSLSFADEKKAVEYASKAGCLHVCREILLENAYCTEEGEKEALVQRQKNNLLFTDKLCRNIYQANYRSPEEEVFACETAIRLWKTLIYDDNFLFFHCRMAEIYSRMAKNYAKLNRRKETLTSLQEAVRHAQKCDERLPGEQHYTSMFVSSATDDASKSSKNYTETEIELIHHSMQDACYDFLRNDAVFLALQK